MYFSSRYRVYLVSKRSNEGIDSASVIDLRFFVRFRESIVLRNAKNNNNCDKELIFMGLLGIHIVLYHVENGLTFTSSFTWMESHISIVLVSAGLTSNKMLSWNRFEAATCLLILFYFSF